MRARLADGHCRLLDPELLRHHESRCELGEDEVIEEGFGGANLGDGGVMGKTGRGGGGGGNEEGGGGRRRRSPRYRKQPVV